MDGTYRSKRAASTDSALNKFPSTDFVSSKLRNPLPILPPRSNSLVSLNSTHSSNSNTSSSPLAYMEEEQEEQEWCTREFTTGSFKTQVYSSVAPYFISHSQGALNWDAITNAAFFEGIHHGAACYVPSQSKSIPGEYTTLPPPKRVLDIGAGIPFFSLNMATFSGWEKSEFVSLDIAPYSLPLELDLSVDVTARISFVQCNFLEGLPFDDNSFDFLRMGYCGIGIPEFQWGNIMSEFSRVLKPGAPIEIIDQDFNVFKSLSSPLSPPTSPLTSPTSPLTHEAATQPTDPFELVDECFDAVLDSRFINGHILGLIPAQLAQDFTRVKSSGTIAIPLSNRPPQPRTTPFINTPFESSKGDLFSSSELGRQSKKHTISSEISRIQLHAYAERFASSSYGIGRDSASVEYERLRKKEVLEVAQLSESDGALLEKFQKKVSKEKRLEELQRERIQVLTEWTSDLKARAGLSQLLENQWGWKCEVDIQAKEILSNNVPAFKEALLEIDNSSLSTNSSGSTSSKGYRKDRSEKDDSASSKEIESRRNQMTVGLRECEVELKNIDRRLGIRNWGVEGEVLGFLETAAFTARAR